MCVEIAVDSLSVDLLFSLSINNLCLFSNAFYRSAVARVNLERSAKKVRQIAAKFWSEAKSGPVFGGTESIGATHSKERP